MSGRARSESGGRGPSRIWRSRRRVVEERVYSLYKRYTAVRLSLKRQPKSLKMNSVSRQNHEPPTEATPEHGCVMAFDTIVSLAEHWEEDGLHVVRSLDFDVIAGDADFQNAIDQFVEKAEDLWSYLSGLETISDHENEMFLKMAPRFLEIYKELERREARRRERLISIDFGRLRQRGEHSLRNWRPSIPASASHPSRA